jgi:quaternary ammonium compound-resistance protein SugE
LGDRSFICAPDRVEVRAQYRFGAIMQMEWIYLIVAGLFEIGWPVGFKLSQTTGFRVLFIILAAISMALSGFFLWLAQREIPIGTAYAVWTGIGASGTFLIGVLFFGDPTTLLRVLSFALILIGVAGLKMS